MEISRPDEAQITWVMDGPGVPDGPAVCTMGLFCSAPPFPAVTSADAAFFHTAWSTVMMTELSGQITLLRTELVTATQGVEFALPDTGSIGGDQESPQVALLFQKVTGQRGRKNRGRLFVPGVPATEVASTGEINGLGAWQETADSLFAALTDWPKDGIPAVLHTDKDDTPTPIDSLIVASLSATQRRRLR